MRGVQLTPDGAGDTRRGAKLSLERLRELTLASPPRLSTAWRLVVAFAAVLVVFLIQRSLLPRPSIAPFVFFFAGVAVASWLGGYLSGLAAVVLSAMVVNYAFLDHAAGSALRPTVLYLVAASLVAVLCASFREAVFKAERTSNELRRHAQMLDLSHDAIVVWRPDAGIETWNRGAEELYGFTASEARGRAVNGLLQTTYPRPWLEIESELRRRGHWEGELAQTARSGRRLVVSAKLQLIRREGVERVLETDRDITDRKLAEDALREADRRKTEFLAILSHELRNPLASITNSLYILEHGSPRGEQAHRAREVIGRQVGQLARMVDDLLEVTRISRGKVHLQSQRLDLGELTRHAIQDNRALFDRAGVGLVFEPPPRPVFVHGDPNRLAQIVGNLLTNAAKFTPRAGRVAIAVGAEEGGTLATCVSPMTVRASRRRCSRGCSSRSCRPTRTLDRSKGGLGLGLALVRGLVEQHGGTVEVTSAGLGQGAEFVIRLPRDAASAPDDERQEAPPAQASRRVLVIEDNLDAANSLQGDAGDRRARGRRHPRRSAGPGAGARVPAGGGPLRPRPAGHERVRGGVRIPGRPGSLVRAPGRAQRLRAARRRPARRCGGLRSPPGEAAESRDAAGRPRRTPAVVRADTGPVKPRAPKSGAVKPGLHPRNRHSRRHDFEQLVAVCPELRGWLRRAPHGGLSVDFADPAAVRALNKALLAEAYGIRAWDIPPGYLCPPVPGRADYLHHLADLLAEGHGGRIPRGPAVRVLDVGVGASVIYPLIGHRDYGWSFVGSDVDETALASASRILAANRGLAQAIVLRRQRHPRRGLRGSGARGGALRPHPVQPSLPRFRARSRGGRPGEVAEAGPRRLGDDTELRRPGRGALVPGRRGGLHPPHGRGERRLRRAGGMVHDARVELRVAARRASGAPAGGRAAGPHRADGAGPEAEPLRGLGLQRRAESAPASRARTMMAARREPSWPRRSQRSDHPHAKRSNHPRSSRCGPPARVAFGPGAAAPARSAAAPPNPFLLSPEERARLDRLSREDHADMMRQLGITKLRPGANGRAAAGEPGAANYDPARPTPTRTGRTS